MGVKLGILPYMKCSKGEELTGDSFIWGRELLIYLSNK